MRHLIIQNKKGIPFANASTAKINQITKINQIDQYPVII